MVIANMNLLKEVRKLTIKDELFTIHLSRAGGTG